MKRNRTTGHRLIETMTLFLMALFAGCSLHGDQKENKWKERPTDFHVSYTWFSGTIEPPHQYKYTVEIGPGSQGKIVFGPTSRFGVDGPVVEYEPPPWTETFLLSEDEVKQLYEVMSKSGVFSKIWKEDPGEARIGGRVRRMRVEGNGDIISVPDALKPADEDAVNNVYAAIESLVPRPLWTKLESQRQRYIEDYTINHRVP